MKFFQVYDVFAGDLAVALDALRYWLNSSSRFRKFVNVRVARPG